MLLSIIIPCYNEDQTILPLLKAIYSLSLVVDFELIIVDDGSERPTGSIISEILKTHSNCRLYRHRKNRGKGNAIRTGLKYARGDYVLIQDADMEYDPSDIPKLLSPVLKFGAKLVYGSRFRNGNKEYNRSHLLANKILTLVTNILLKTRLTDMETGYKLISRDILSKIRIEGQSFEIEPEITLKAVMSGFKIVEVPITYHHRVKGKAKINPTDGIEAILYLIINRFFSKSVLLQAFYRAYKFRMKEPMARLIRMFLYRFMYRGSMKFRRS